MHQNPLDHDKSETLQSYIDDLIPLAKFSEITGITRKAIYEKISAQKWRYGYEVFKDPDGKIWVSREGYQLWVREGANPITIKEEGKNLNFKKKRNLKIKIQEKSQIPQLK